MKEPTYLLKNATTTVVVVNSSTDMAKAILRGVVDVGDATIEFFIDNEKKYGCIYEIREKVSVDVDEDGVK